MPDIVATCDNCGFTLPTGIHIEGDATNITMIGNRSNCPNCGRMRNIPNGIYNSINGIISYVNTSRDPLKTAEELKADLEKIRNGRSVKSEHITKVEQFLRNNKQTITVALAVLTLAIALYKYDQKPKEAEVNKSNRKNRGGF